MDPTHFHSILLSTKSKFEPTGYVGGIVAPFVPAVDLSYGDAVFLAAGQTVNKSTTPADYVAFMGFVVGGDVENYMNADFRDVTPTNTKVATAVTGVAFVQISGIVWAVADAAIATNGGVRLIGSAIVAGRVASGTTAGQMLGTSITSAAGAGSLFPILIDHR